MEFLEHQAKHPEDEIEDSTIMQCFGWRSADSISSYRDYNNQVIAYETMKNCIRRRGSRMIQMLEIRTGSAIWEIDGTILRFRRLKM